MAKVLVGLTQDLSLVLEVLAFHLDSRQNVFNLGKITFENLLKNPNKNLVVTYCHDAGGSLLSSSPRRVISLFLWVVDDVDNARGRRTAYGE